MYNNYKSLWEYAMNNDIIINGINLQEFKKQKESMTTEAAKMIGQQLELAKSLTTQLINSQDKDEIKQLAHQAYEALNQAKEVSEISGVAFLLPFYEEYGSYDDNEIFSYQLDNCNNPLFNEIWGTGSGLKELFDLFEDMESQSRDWYSGRG